MKCPECRTPMRESIENVRYDECGLEGITLTNVTVRHCPKCGERAVGIRDIDGLHRELAQHIARRAEKLGPAEIKFLRKRLGLSGGDFAKVMSTDPSTVSRWESKEKPQAMGEQSEKLLRMLVLSGYQVEKYPLEEMASKPMKALRMRMVSDDSGWHAAA